MTNIHWRTDSNRLVSIDDMEEYQLNSILESLHKKLIDYKELKNFIGSPFGPLDEKDILNYKAKLRVLRDDYLFALEWLPIIEIEITSRITNKKG